VAHSGDGEGWTSAAVRIDDADLVVVVLTNTESYARHAQVIACAIARRILSISDSVINDLALTSAEQAGFAGKYGNGLELLSQNGVLFAQLWPGGPRNRLLYQGKGTFVLDSARDMMLNTQRDQRSANWVVVRAGGVFAFAAADERRTITCESQNSHQTDSGSGFERLPRMCDPELLELPGISVAARERDRLTHGPRHVGGQLR